MSNITFMRLVGSSYALAALANDDVTFQPNNINNSNNNNTHSSESNANNNHSSGNFLLVFEDNYSYRSTSTIVLMVAAWILLILGFVFCCCAECFGISVWRGKKRASISLSGAESGSASTTTVNGDELSDLHAADRANHSDANIEVCRHCPPDYEAESLPSYTIVSGLPTYDDALEEFRKAGIILTPAIVPVIKIFENVSSDAVGAKEPTVAYSLVETTAGTGNDANGDNISLTSITCNCGGNGGISPTNNTTLPSYSAATAAAMVAATAAGTPLNSQVIELSPEHLASLSQKRLSLQISFNNSLRRRSRSRSTLRNQLLRTCAVRNSVGLGPIDATVAATAAAATTAIPAQPRGNPLLPPIHRSSSTISLSNERQLLDQRLRHLHHRGSLY
ncbi:probable serine/threonine-protein kinase roco8 isoform X2 [Drosophila innubila]|uniref:probable serine/threonine-protein kinase roco8 isoform X2 n=1 Tax=Drosophila innubila TaxID=198719 RepID=UPI00148E244B|nr:probable serine/threonine-protein kinase roco8 isoform X2 [Drosophila innubila]